MCVFLLIENVHFMDHGKSAQFSSLCSEVFYSGEILCSMKYGSACSLSKAINFVYDVPGSRQRQRFGLYGCSTLELYCLSVDSD